DNDPITKSATVDLISDESSYFTFDDDGPSLTVNPSTQGTGGLAVELDETVGTDRYAPGEAADGGNADDAGPGLGQKTSAVPGGLKALFLVGGDFGSDGAGTLTDGLSFVGIPVGGLPTNLEATDGGAITLFANGDTLIEGKDTDGDIVFTIAIVDAGGGVLQLQTTLFEALVHGDNSKFDETVELLVTQGLVQLEYEVTRTDDDGDPITDSATIDLVSNEGSYFTFDDDGPSLTVNPSTQGTGGLAVELDETVGTDRAASGEVADGNTDDAGPGLGQKTSTVPGGLKALFLVGGDFGSDGPGTLTDKLSFGGFGGGDLDTNLEATDGGAIVLYLDSPTLIQGKDGDGDVVFTIEIVEVNP
ncbi:MAG: hemolysin-type calcium-binding protein, partial [Gordonia sp.]|nr:hemolysin-type calcium-binding protein [Gordonia sp. (in: high G+C Gram-positive bacteria)]